MDNACRTCLRNSKDLLPLFGDMKLPHKIKTISSIEVSPDDNLPDKVCAECIVNINLSYNFRRVVIISDRELKDRYVLEQKEQHANKVNDTSEESNLYKTSFIKREKVDSSFSDVNNENDTVNTLIKDDILKIELKDDLITVTENINVIQEETIVSAFKECKSNISNNRNRLFKCDKCNFESSARKKYNMHIQTHTMRMCTICGKFISALNFNKHITIHTGEPAQCKQCGKVCKNTESLRGHVVVHNGINRKCKICGEVFTERAVYVGHMKTHQSEDEKYVKCPLCDKRIQGKRGLQKHIRSHTGERPYPCEFCKKGFSSGHALKTHIRRHTNERPYKCALCTMAFPQKVSLRNHLKSKHNEESTDNVN